MTYNLPLRCWDFVAGIIAYPVLMETVSYLKCIWEFILSNGANVNGTLADWASAIGTILAVIVACIAAIWAKKSSDTSIEISRKSIDVDEFASANEILKTLCQQAVSDLEKTQQNHEGIENNLQQYCAFTVSVRAPFFALEELSLSDTNKEKCAFAISCYLGLKVYHEIKCQSYRSKFKINELSDSGKSLYEILDESYALIQKFLDKYKGLFDKF